MIATRRSRVPAQRWRPRPAWLVLLVGLAMLATGLAGWLGIAGATPDRGLGPAAAVHTAAPAPAAAPSTVQPTPPQTPLRLALPSLEVDAPVVPVDVGPGAALQVPEDPDVLGWWQGGTRPGSAQGTVVIDGHVDTARNGPGALYQLRRLRPGDQVQLGTDDGTQRYMVAAVRSFPKTALPPEVFATDGQPRLVLITCGGAFDQRTRQYADNIVAYAIPR